MRSRRFTIGAFLTLLLGMTLLLGGCVKDEVSPNPTPNGKDREVMILLRLPSGGSSVNTRAIVNDSDDDNHIEEIDILLFQGGKFVSSVMSNNINKKNGLVVVTTRLPVAKYELVALANVHSLVEGAQISVGEDKESIFSRLTTSMDSKGWNSFPDEDDYIHFPMWGESEGEVDIATTQDINLTMYRMLARANITLNYDLIDGKADFELQTIRLYNYNKVGRIAPNAEKWGASPRVASAVKSMADKLEPILFDSKHIEHKETNKQYLCKDEIFLFESAADNEGAWAWNKNTCLVLGGLYKGVESYYRVDFISSNNNIDLLRNNSYNFSISSIKNQGYSSKEEALENKPHNIEYTVHPWDDINAGDVIVNGDTQLTVSPSSRINVDLLEESTLLEIYTNYKDGWQIEKIGDKYRIEGEDGSLVDWITLDNGGTTAAGAKNLKVTAHENDANTERTAYIHITCGLIRHKLTVTQSNEIGVSINIFRKTAEGNWTAVSSIRMGQPDDKTQAEAVSYKVMWTPQSESVSVKLSPRADSEGTIVWDGATSMDGVVNGELTNSAGEVEFTLQPKLMNYTRGSFAEHKDLLDFEITAGGRTATKQLLLEHFVGDVAVESLGGDGAIYQLDGGGHNVKVKANVPWAMHLTENRRTVNVGRAVIASSPHLAEGGEPILVATGESNVPNGENITLTTVDDRSRFEVLTGVAAFTVGPLDENSGIAPYTKRITCAVGILQRGREANCYVLDPTVGEAILIPVRAANGVMVNNYDGTHAANNWRLADGGVTIEKKLGTNTEFGARLVWADEPASNNTGLGRDGLLTTVVPVGRGDSGYILVVPGTQRKTGAQNLTMGNAVVAVTDRADGTGNILWSWHIWVTDGVKLNNKGLVMGGHFGGGVAQNGSVATGSATWLDRNLGALSNGYNPSSKQTPITDAAVLTYTKGLHYQWGRKDPFPAANTVLPDEIFVEEYEQLIYDETGLIKPRDERTGSVIHRDFTVGTGIAISIQEPLSFAKNWQNITGITGEGVNTWGHTGSKTIFDPCPAGWRLPLNGDWGTINDESYWGSMAPPLKNYGRTYTHTDNYKGGYYSAAGVRHSNGLDWTGRGGSYWSRSPYNVTHSNHFDYTSERSCPIWVNSRSYGFSVRCVAE